VSVPHASIYVLDTGPLITLAAADSLDYLLYPNLPVVIPDAVSSKPRATARSSARNRSSIGSRRTTHRSKSG
jgi:hypothetical protein